MMVNGDGDVVRIFDLKLEERRNPNAKERVLFRFRIQRSSRRTSLVKCTNATAVRVLVVSLPHGMTWHYYHC
jgi:hypothetical protein